MPVLWPPHPKSWLVGKDSDAGRDWGQEEKGTTEDEMAGWHHWPDGRESEWTLGVGVDREAWRAAIHGVTKSGTRLSDWTELNWSPKNWCFQIGVLENTLESPLDIMETKPVNPKGSQPWIFIGRTDAVAEAPNTLATWCEEPTHWKRTQYWERLGVEERGHRVWDGWKALPTQWTWVWVNYGSWCGQGGLACCNSWRPKESDTTERLNGTEGKHCISIYYEQYIINLQDTMYYKIAVIPI